MRRFAALTTILVIAGLFGHTQAEANTSRIQCLKNNRVAVNYYRGKTWSYQQMLGMKLNTTTYHEKWTASCKYARWLADLWRFRAFKHRDIVQRHNDPVSAIILTFGRYAQQALIVARCESGLSVYAQNGQYLGLFQMGNYARSRYGHGYTALQQARSAYQYFADSGYDWSPWSCKPY